MIKISLKSDMSIIWLDIWDVQSSSKARGLINRCFNIESYIATICQDREWWTLFLFSLFLVFYFSFSFSFIFLFLEQLGLGFISHAVTSVTN